MFWGLGRTHREAFKGLGRHHIFHIYDIYRVLLVPGHGGSHTDHGPFLRDTIVCFYFFYSYFSGHGGSHTDHGPEYSRYNSMF